MTQDALSDNESKAIAATRQRVCQLARFLASNQPPDSDSACEWLDYLTRFKDGLGNLNNNIGFFATLLAKEYLVKTLAIPPFDAADKAQGAPGLDIDLRTANGRRVIAEIKTTHPYKLDDLGSKQLETFKKDAERLRSESADHKFFFLTDSETFDIMKKPRYRELFHGIRVILLPSGDEVVD